MPAEDKPATVRPRRRIQLEDGDQGPRPQTGPAGPAGPRGPNRETGPVQPNAPSDDDFERLARMLERIRKTLALLIHLNPPVIADELQLEFVKNWPEAEEQLVRAISQLREPRSDISAAPSRRLLRRRLASAGMTGEMLRMKEVSLNYHLDRVERTIFDDVQLKPSVTDRVIATLVRWFRPASKVVNSILGSVINAFPGIEIVKELKEHLEASYEIADATREEREE